MPSVTSPPPGGCTATKMQLNPMDTACPSIHSSGLRALNGSTFRFWSRGTLDTEGRSRLPCRNVSESLLLSTLSTLTESVSFIFGRPLVGKPSQSSAHCSRPSPCAPTSRKKPWGKYFFVTLPSMTWPGVSSDSGTLGAPSASARRWTAGLRAVRPEPPRAGQPRGLESAKQHAHLRTARPALAISSRNTDNSHLHLGAADSRLLAPCGRRIRNSWHKTLETRPAGAGI
mmetsp:Transcript_38364/g.109515  ORF Transcript_38364/g.109515 Transcript_38364/m.109515 type:complete len:229 (+) Transcript_38364:180-866(+)